MVLTMAALCLSACHRATSPTDLSLTDFATGVTAADGSTGTLHPGLPPSGASGPIVTATSTTSGNVTGRGSDVVNLHGLAPFQTVYVSVNDTDGFFQVQLAAPTTDATVALATASNIPRSSFTARYFVGSPAGLVGLPAAVADIVTPSANVAPANDSYTTARGTTLIVPAPGVFGNDQLGSSSGYRAVFLEFAPGQTPPASVAVFQNLGSGNGGFLLTPVSTFGGVLTLHYVIYYLFGSAQFVSSVATVTINVS